MNTRSRLRRAIDNPLLFLRQVNRLYHRRFGRRRYNTAGIDFFDEEWDNLLLLDACRYDVFANRSSLPGRLEHRESRGSTTIEFLRANVDGNDLRDTVYVTANPQLHQHRETVDERFHDVIDVWTEDGWDEQSGTVLPETMTEYAIQAADAYPNKRLVVHYIQPHYPFIDSQTEFDKSSLTDTGATEENLWYRLLQTTLDVSREEIWKLYAENLDRTLPHVDELMAVLNGTTVVSADHGNMIGERAFPIPFREWGHPRGIYTTELIDVPWLVYENGTRRHIYSEATADENETETVDDGIVADRLRNLGYAE